MKEKQRKQFSIRLNTEDLRDVEKVRKQHNFKSVYQYLFVCVRIVTRILNNLPKIESTKDDFIGDMFSFFSSYEQENLYPTKDKEKSPYYARLFEKGTEPKKEIKREFRYKEYTNRFIEENYSLLSSLFFNKQNKRKDLYSPIDICHDVLSELYYAKEEFKNYEEFEKFALKKFKQKGV